MKPEINISNYEEFFLLYVDGELSATGKQAVEQFVLAHPDLAVELEMLQQMQLPQEQFVFENKNALYHNETEAINLANYEEQFLLYVDNELTGDAKGKVETFVLQHPTVQESFTLLKQTKLEPEPIVFADKQLLYRKEEKERRVFYLGWQRIAVAAALIGLIVLLWNVLPNDTTNQKQTARVVRPVTPAVVTGGTQPPATAENATKVNTDQIASVTGRPGNAVITAQNPSTLQQGIDPVSVNPVAQQVDIIVKPTEIHKEEPVTSAPHNSFPTTVTTTQALSGENSTVNNVDLVRTNATPDGSQVQPAVYKELDTEVEDEKKSLLLGSLEINKDKLRGFFRKAGSLFRSKSKTEEDNKTESRPSSSNTRALP